MARQWQIDDVIHSKLKIKKIITKVQIITHKKNNIIFLTLIISNIKKRPNM